MTYLKISVEGMSGNGRQVSTAEAAVMLFSTEGASSPAAMKVTAHTADRRITRLLPKVKLASAADARPRQELISSRHTCRYLPGREKMWICMRIMKTGH